MDKNSQSQHSVRIDRCVGQLALMAQQVNDPFTKETIQEAMALLSVLVHPDDQAFDGSDREQLVHHSCAALNSIAEQAATLSRLLRFAGEG